MVMDKTRLLLKHRLGLTMSKPIMRSWAETDNGTEVLWNPNRIRASYPPAAWPLPDGVDDWPTDDDGNYIPIAIA